MKTDKDNDPADFGNAPLAAFEAGMKSQAPMEVISGILIHHRDLVISDQTAKHLAETKRSLPGPLNPAGTITLHTMESFTKAVLDRTTPRTKTFADSEAWVITSVFDFLADESESSGGEKTGWGQLRAELNFKESRKVKEWRKTLDWMNQADFANFLEDHLEDVVTPEGQDLLGLVTDLEASLDGSFKGKINLSNGAVKLAYQSDVETSVEVPKTLTLGIPLFEHGERYKLTARLRFNITGQGVRFKLLFTNLDDSKEKEFERVAQEIEEKTSAVIYRGKLSLPW